MLLKITCVNDICNTVLHPSRHRQPVTPLPESLKRRVLRQQLRSERDESFDLFAIHAEDQGFAAREMPVQCTRANPGLLRDRVQRCIWVCGKRITRHFENTVFICLCVGSLTAFCHGS